MHGWPCAVFSAARSQRHLLLLLSAMIVLSKAIWSQDVQLQQAVQQQQQHSNSFICIASQAEKEAKAAEEKFFKRLAQGTGRRERREDSTGLPLDHAVLVQNAAR